MATEIKIERLDSLAPPTPSGALPSPSSIATSKNSQTPSPSTPASCHGHGEKTGSRRPPRKSTLTQQQKNQKRQRATQEQLATLEEEFNKNPTPTAPVRDNIAKAINMTERSVQIWFQNRYVAQCACARHGLACGSH